MAIYNVAVIVVDLVEADSPEEAERTLINHLGRAIDGDVSSPNDWPRMPGLPFISEPLPEGTPVVR